MNALNILPSYTDYFQLTSATIGLNSGIVWIGAIIGSLLSAKIPDTIGRRPALFYSAIIAVIGTILQAASQNIAMFLVARFILGLGVGGTYVATPLLLAESSAMQYRTFSLGAFTDLYYVGGLLSSGIKSLWKYYMNNLTRRRYHLWNRRDGFHLGMAPPIIAPTCVYRHRSDNAPICARISQISRLPRSP